MFLRKITNNLHKSLSYSAAWTHFSRSLSTVEVRGIIEKRYDELCRRFQGGDPESVAQMYTHNCQLLTYGERPIYGRKGVEEFSATFMGNKMDTMHIDVLAVEYGGGDTAVDNHRNITTKTTPEGATHILSSKDIVVWKCVDGKWLLHIDMYTPDPPGAELYKREFEEMNGKWIGLYQMGDMTLLSEMYTSDCRVLADNMLLKHSRLGCKEVYQNLQASGINFFKLECNGAEDIGNNLTSITGSFKTFNNLTSQFKEGKYLRICKRTEDGNLYIHWECFNYDS